MTSHEQIFAGLEILGEYLPEGESGWEPYEDDGYIFDCNLHPVDMHIDDIEHLAELDWHWDEDAYMWKHSV